MKFIKLLIRFIKNPYKYAKSLGFKNRLKFLPDTLYLKWVFRGAMDKKLNLRKPKTYNEKLQWLKLYDRNPEYTKLVDKYLVREHIKKILGNTYLIPLYGVYDKFEDINFEFLPQQFVLKCTHDSGSVIICKNKDKFNYEYAREKLNNAMNKNHYYKAREWAYKNVKPRIICEKYLIDKSVNDLWDYKIFCFSGEPKLIQVDFDRFGNHKRNLYNVSWEFLNKRIKLENDPYKNIPSPYYLQEMLDISRKLSKNIPHVRIDFYLIDNKLFFGEYTFYHGSGFEKMYPYSFGIEMGSWIRLPQKKLKS